MSIHLSIGFVDSFKTHSFRFSCLVTMGSHWMDFPAFLELAKMGHISSRIEMEKRVWSGFGVGVDGAGKQFEVEWNEIDGIGK